MGAEAPPTRATCPRSR
ncbi:hypothetical protein ACFQ0H_09235 [Lysobacter gummosus]